MRIAALSALAVTACSSTPPPTTDHPLGWLTGCWESETGDYREVWSEPESGYLFSYALSYEDDAVNFFEQLRISPGDGYVLNAYPAGKGPSPFFETARGANHVTFTNSEHDFPQVITYALDRETLTAHVATLDETQGFDLTLAPCSRG